jgi:hypothetical protein
MPLGGIVPPKSTVYDLMLLVHIGVALIALISMIAAGVAARSLRRTPAGHAWSQGGARYFSPGPDVVGRTLYLIPLSGAALIGLSHHAITFHDAFVIVGLVLWALVALTAELAVFRPGDRLRALVESGDRAPSEELWRRDAAAIALGVDVVVVLVLAASVVMIAQP